MTRRWRSRLGSALAAAAVLGGGTSLCAGEAPARIVSLNLAGLVALVASILYLSQFRAGLIDARAQSLLVQAEIIAGAGQLSANGDEEEAAPAEEPATA